MQTWIEMRKRQLKEVNDNSIATAVLTSAVVNSFAAFGGKNHKNVTPDMFLPFLIDDEESPKGKLKTEISTRTAKIIMRMWEENRIPAPIMRVIAADQMLYSVIKEKAGEM